MRRGTTAITAALGLAACLASGACQRQPTEVADLVLINGRVLTVDSNDTVAEAVAVAGGTIVAVGSN